jgi:alkyl hydroperoxide reductase subunit AhpC
VGISADSVLSHIAWQKKEIGLLSFPICADFFPHGEVTRQFGILREGPPVPGIPERAAFVVDKTGTVRFAKVYPLDQVPDVDEILAAVAAAQ